MPRAKVVLLLCALCAACSEETRDPTVDLGHGGDVTPSSETAPGVDMSPAVDGTPDAPAANADAAAMDSGSADGDVTAASWILNHFSGAPVLTGSFTARTKVETPRLVLNASGTGAKYAFDVRDESAPNDKEAGFVNVTITNLVSPDAFGAGIVTYDPGMTLYLSQVHIEPNWPTWVDYSTTNKDGVVLDGSVAFYAEDLTIKGINADAGIDNKAPISQLVRLQIDGPANRSIRYWGNGPHYLVDSSIDNPGTAGAGALLWFKDCDNVELRVYGTSFNGSPTVPPSKIECDTGSGPQITYLTTDPRTTGELHPMFVAP